MKEWVDIIRQKDERIEELETRFQKWSADDRAKILDLESKVRFLEEQKAYTDRWLSGGVYFTTEEYKQRVKEQEALRQDLQEVTQSRDEWKRAWVALDQDRKQT